MTAPIVYRWDDANAPVARGERRSLPDILHACLVTGYGSKPAAGWTREYVNATFDTAAFRNSVTDGTGFYLQANGLGGGDAFSPIVRAFETMTSESNGFGPFATSYANTFQVSNIASTTPHPWLLIADNRAFYLFIWFYESAASLPGVSAATAVLFFGDLVRRKSDDYFCCALTSGGNGCLVGMAYASATGAGSTYNSFYMPRTSMGVNTPIVASHIRGGGPGGETACGSVGPTWAAGDQILISRPHVNDAAMHSLRGWLPGYYYPCHPLAFSQLASISSDGKNFLSVRHQAGGGPYANSFISLDDWWA